jgi:hypothetical protein
LKAIQLRFKKFLSFLKSNNNDNVNDSNNDNINTFTECGIYLEEYEAGDEFCLSYNDDCNHIFHEDCNISWLTSHQEYPNCRVDVLKPIY